MKRSRDYALKERAAHRLKGCLRKQILKVASEQRSPKYFVLKEISVGYDGVVPVTGHDEIK